MCLSLVLEHYQLGVTSPEVEGGLVQEHHGNKVVTLSCVGGMSLVVPVWVDLEVTVV